MNHLPSVDDELEEIKRLIEGDINAILSSDKYADAGKPEIGLSDTPGNAGTGKSGADLHTARQKPAASPPGQKPGVPAVRQSPGVPQPKPMSGVPAVRQSPGVPQLKPTPGVPSAPQKRQPPARQEKPLPPEDPNAPGHVRSYDISPGGKITKASGTEPELDVGSKRFKIKFDFDSAYKDVPEDKPLRLRREKRTGCVGGILYSAFVISISLVFATLMWMATVDVLGFGAENEQVNITVPTGFDMEEVTDMLYDAGLIQYKSLFSIYADFSNAEEKITAGSYVLNKSFDYRALVQGMTARAGVRVETTVTIPEGFTMAQIFTLLEDYGVVGSASQLWRTATYHDFNFSFLDKETLGQRLRLEGFLFPDTYNFYLDSKPEQVIIRLLREFDRRFTEEYTDRAEDMGYSVHDIIIVASMIEREAGSEEERPRIAAVIYNRLKSKDFPNLQIDATIHYAIAGTGRPFSTDIDHPYNTYLHEGLPPGPIASPSMASIRAALYPDSTNEYYYALNREGTHNFFRTRAQQEAFVKSDEYGGR